MISIEFHQAGKSSLIGSLFRIAEVEGNIIIDKKDTAQIPLEQLRSNIAIIPQDPGLLMIILCIQDLV